MAFMKTISIDGHDVEIADLSDEILVSELRHAEAGVVSSALGEIETWNDLAAKQRREAKLKSLQNEVRKRKLQVD
jgi:hypothetical protein